MDKLPHIIIFNPDQFRSDALGHLGNSAAVTPNLDKISEEDGVSFRYAFCQNPVCTPSRCSFMSGWYPHVRGHRSMHHLMHEDEPILLRTLKEQGYYVWWAGKNDLIAGHELKKSCYDVRYNAPKSSLKPMRGIDIYEQRRGEPGDDDYYSFYVGKLDTEENDIYYDKDWANFLGALEFIRNAPQDRPVCIYLSLSYPHPHYGVEEPWYSMIDRSKVPERIPAPENWEGMPSMKKGIYERQNLQNWNEEKWTELRATYYAMCTRIDHQFGLLMDALKEKGMYDDSAVFVFSDHGDYTGDYGMVEKTQNTFEDCLTRVPFIIKPPSWVHTKPHISDALVELIDFSATVEALTGIKPKHTHFGKSLLPVITGETETHRDAVFCEGGRLHGEIHCMELESKGSHDPAQTYWPRLSLQASEGPEHTKAVMLRTTDFKYVRRLYESDELYDLKKDPQELHNRINDPDLKEVLLELKERMLTYYMETGDVVPHTTDSR